MTDRANDAISPSSLAKRRSAKGLAPVQVAGTTQINRIASSPDMSPLGSRAPSISTKCGGSRSPSIGLSPKNSARLAPDPLALPSFAKHGILRRASTSAIDLRSGVRLAPIPNSPHSAKIPKEDAWRNHPVEPRGEKAKIDEAVWGTSVLLSLSPKFSKIKNWGSPKMSTAWPRPPPKLAELENSHQASGNRDSRGMDEDPDCSDCGPRLEDALASLGMGSDGLSHQELRQMTMTFNRYKPVDCSEVQKEALQVILTHLGHFFVTKSKVESLANEVTDFGVLDFQEFESFVAKWCEFEKREIQSIFSAAQEKKNGAFFPDEMACLLKPLGIVFVRVVVLEAFQKAKLEHTGCRTSAEFLKFLAAYQAAQGFSHDQLIAARKAFDDNSVHDFDKRVLKATKHSLSIALVQARGEHVAQLLPEILEGIHWDFYVGISFRDFCSFLRRLWEIELKLFEATFVEECEDAEGSVDSDVLSDIMKASGFTIFLPVSDEILEEMQATSKTFSFSDAVQFLLGCQRRKGFSRGEFTEYSDVFKRFDYDGSNDIDHLELVDMLRFLGYSANLKESRRLLDKFDFKETGTLDFSGFLYFMRLHREQELKVIFRTYEDCKDECDDMTPSMLNEALEKLGYEPMSDVVQQLLREIGDPDILSYENFVYVVDHFRRLSTIEKRKRAGFSDKEFHIVRDLFTKHTSLFGEDAKLVKGGLILLLIEAGIALDTNDKRKEVFEMLERAREAARSVGIQEACLGQPQSPRCKFWPLVHLLRLIFQKSDRRAVQREEEAVEETQFQPSEVQQFRDIFLKCCRGAFHDDAPMGNNEQSPALVSQSRGRRASVGAVPDMASFKRNQAEAQHEGSQNMSLRDAMGGDPEAVFAKVRSILSVLEKKLGMRFSQEQKIEFAEKVNSITGKDDNMLDFPNFLRLMKWMLTIDFANIKAVADKVVERVRSSSG